MGAQRQLLLALTLLEIEFWCHRCQPVPHPTWNRAPGFCCRWRRLLQLAVLRLFCPGSGRGALLLPIYPLCSKPRSLFVPVGERHTNQRHKCRCEWLHVQSGAFRSDGDEHANAVMGICLPGLTAKSLLRVWAGLGQWSKCSEGNEVFLKSIPP